EREAFENLDLLDFALLVDDCFNDDDAGNVAFAGCVGVVGLGAGDRNRSLDVAADAKRSFILHLGCRRRRWRRSGLGVAAFTGSGAADGSADDATFFTAE